MVCFTTSKRHPEPFHQGVEIHTFVISTHHSDLPLGSGELKEVDNIPEAMTRIGIQSTCSAASLAACSSLYVDWANHGICGRGVLLDLVRYFGDTLPYDPWKSSAVLLQDIQKCAEKQNVKFQRGDILLLRVGFIKKYNESSVEARDKLAETGNRL